MKLAFAVSKIIHNNFPQLLQLTLWKQNIGKTKARYWTIPGKFHVPQICLNIFIPYHFLAFKVNILQGFHNKTLYAFTIFLRTATYAFNYRLYKNILESLIIDGGHLSSARERHSTFDLLEIWLLPVSDLSTC